MLVMSLKPFFYHKDQFLKYFHFYSSLDQSEGTCSQMSIKNLKVTI